MATTSPVTVSAATALDLSGVAVRLGDGLGAASADFVVSGAGISNQSAGAGLTLDGDSGTQITLGADIVTVGGDVQFDGNQLI